MIEVTVCDMSVQERKATIPDYCPDCETCLVSEEYPLAEISMSEEIKDTSLKSEDGSWVVSYYGNTRSDVDPRTVATGYRCRKCGCLLARGNHVSPKQESETGTRVVLRDFLQEQEVYEEFTCADRVLIPSSGEVLEYEGCSYWVATKKTSVTCGVFSVTLYVTLKAKSR